MQMFFSSRSAARSVSFGKMTDNGSTATKRWARTVTATASNPVESVAKCGKRLVKVVTKRSHQVK